MSGEGMTDFVTSLTGTNGITSTNLWTEVSHAAPLIIGIFVFAFGYYVVRKVVKGGSRGKLKM